MISPGQVIGRYRLLGELGRGGMGVVFAAEHVELHSRAAIKLLHHARALQEVGVQRFLREARAAAQIKHLHTVSVIDVGTHEDQWFIVMELLEGETLADMIAREAPLLTNRIAELLLPAAAAVSAAHEAGVIHRDLKPANIVLARRGRRIVHPVITDFGISKLLVDTTAEGITSSHSLLGTLHYMAPELTRAADRATPSSDQYSLGVILYECATGRRPFQGDSPYELMHAIVTGAFPHPRSICGAIDPTLEAIILRAMDREPSRRYPSVAALGSALLTCADQKTWVNWASELTADADTPVTAADNAGLVRTPAARQSPSGSWRTQRARSATYAIGAGILALAVVWFAARGIHQRPGYAPANDSKRSLGDTALAVGNRSDTLATSVIVPRVSTCSSAIHAATVSLTSSDERHSRGSEPPRAVERLSKAIRRGVAATAAKPADTGARASSSSASSLNSKPNPEFGTNNAPILD